MIRLTRINNIFAQITPMRVLLVAASVLEIRPFLDQLRIIEKSSPQLTRYLYGKTEVDVLIPGIGMVPTACHLAHVLSLNDYFVAVNAGIAGSYDHAIPVGSVVEVMEDNISELGADDKDSHLSIFDLGLADPDEYPYQNGRLMNVYPIKDNPVLSQIKKVKGNTVNSMNGDIQVIERVRRNSGADIESMEGAAFLYVCLHHRLNNIQLRSISNFVEERDKSAWDLKKSIRNLNEVIVRLFHTL
jgi:futalosine hydrolase